jgi:Ca2+-binding RTX toxin-like protein
VLHGGTGADILIGGPQADLLYADSGADRLHGGPGDDEIHINDRGRAASVDCGGGEDTLYIDPPGARGHVSDRQLLRRGGVKGCEHVVPQAAPRPDPKRGITWIAPLTGAVKHGTRRNDTLLGSHGPDRVYGRGGADVIWGNLLHNDPSSAHDRLVGEAGADVIYGGPGSNLILGGEGDDYLQGGKGRNTIRGGPGDDGIRLRGRGPNSVDAGPGNDVVYAYSRRPTRITCGPGFDTVEVDKHDTTAGDCERIIRH